MTTSTFTGNEWPAADALFHRDPRWRGGDDAYSIELAPGRLLWLFGDTFIGDGTAPRRDCTFIRNSIALQSGSDPETADIEFFWGDGPASFFPEIEGEWLWPGDGVYHDGRLLLFFMRVRSAAPRPHHDPVEDWREQGPLSFFDAYTCAVRLVENPADNPRDWRIEEVEPPATPDGFMIGSGGVFVDGDRLFACTWTPGGVCRLVSWASEEAMSGDLSLSRWEPTPIFEGAATEFSIHRDASGLLLVQSVGLAPASIATRRADAPAGPWSEPSVALTPADSLRSDAWTYAAKAHPSLDAGTDQLAVTYASNGRDVDVTLDDETIYYPRFARLREGEPQA